MSDNFRVAAKALIIRDGKLLMIKRRSNDVHKPGAWDIPGGRLNPGEDPYEGLKRETREELSVEIDIVMPLAVNHFVRDDGQQITLIMFLSRLKTDNLALSEEHQELRWIDVQTESAQIPDFFQTAISNYRRLKHD